MRLHHLGITAFGPFSERVEIDFDALSGAGLFLLTGPTGAGKTSVLDAVSFALYGDVPGDRSAAKRLRSDHAAPGTAPEVALEVTLAGRRFRFVRSPAWERPKKRGTGTTRQQAHVVVSERVEGQWETLSTRLDETGDLVQSLVGMNLDQFCQVAMLPQGRFQAFLRARSEERQALLQQLFRTGRFARMEGWLRDRRLRLHRASRESHDQVAGLVNRFSEAAAHPCPEEWDLGLLDAPAGDRSLRGWSEAGLETLVRRVEETDQALAGLTVREQHARTQLDQARELSRQQERLQTAERGWAELTAAEEAHRSRVSELEDARRAAAVLPLHQLARSTRRRTEEEAARVVRLTARVRDLGGPPESDPDLPAAQARVATQRRALSPALEAEECLGARQVRLAALQGELARAQVERASAIQALATVPQRRDEVEQVLRRSHAAQARLPECEGRVADLGRRTEARAAADALTAELEDAEEQRRTFRDEVQALVQTWLDLREARLAGMAAEIAGVLTAGCGCPVCGSSDHPRPASPLPGAPDAETERAAQRHADDARAVLLAHDDRVHQLRTRLEVARGTSGDETEESLRAALQNATEDLTAAQTLVAGLAEQETACAALATEEQRLQEELRAWERESARLESSVVDLEEEVRRLTETIRSALDGTAFATVAEQAERMDQLDDALRAVASARESLDTLREQQVSHDEAVARGLDEHGFADVPAAERGARDLRQQETLVAAVQAHEAQRASLGSVLADPELVRAAGEPVPDLAHLELEYSQVRTDYEAGTTESDRARRARERGASLAAELHQALDRWEPLRQEHATVAALAALAEGKSVDNRLQMRLSAYVLAYRLTQVVHAANARLAGMSDQRYTLQHSGQRGAGESRGGLSLTVLDEWSGASRDPATLSGGETFIVSLALALGLADVITQEAGGTDLDTLFVDEGFGSLDADSLDHVLDTLDALRDGGRVVGVVSHVTEMSERIPTQLKVSKARCGSAVEVTVGA